MFKNSIRSTALMFAAAAAMCLISQEADAQICPYTGRPIGVGGSSFSLSIGTGGFNRGFGGIGGLYGGGLYGGGLYGGGLYNSSIYRNNFYGGGFYGGGFNRGINIQSYRPVYGRSIYQVPRGHSYYRGGGNRGGGHHHRGGHRR